MDRNKKLKKAIKRIEESTDHPEYNALSTLQEIPEIWRPKTELIDKVVTICIKAMKEDAFGWQASVSGDLRHQYQRIVEKVVDISARGGSEKNQKKLLAYLLESKELLKEIIIKMGEKSSSQKIRNRITLEFRKESPSLAESADKPTLKILLKDFLEEGNRKQAAIIAKKLGRKLTRKEKDVLVNALLDKL